MKIHPQGGAVVKPIFIGGRVRTPLIILSLPGWHQHLGLIQTVKRYERLTVETVHQHSQPLAGQALMAHLLVLSYSCACPLVGAIKAP